MYIVRWLMGHPIIATWVLGAIAIILTMGSTNVIIDKPSHATKIHSERAGINNQGDVKVGTIVSFEEGRVISPESKKLDKAQTKGIVEIVTIDTDRKTNNNVIPTSISAAMPEVRMGATADLTQVTNEEMLLMAREAYWNNGLDEAAQIYHQLIRNEPSAIGYQGELGNVYWRQGYPKKAAEIYSKIAIPMINNGGAERASNMIGSIGLFYPDRAADIQKLIQSKSIKQ